MKKQKQEQQQTEARTWDAETAENAATAHDMMHDDAATAPWAEEEDGGGKAVGSRKDTSYRQRDDDEEEHQHGDRLLAAMHTAWSAAHPAQPLVAVAQPRCSLHYQQLSPRRNEARTWNRKSVSSTSPQLKMKMHKSTSKSTKLVS